MDTPVYITNSVMSDELHQGFLSIFRMRCIIHSFGDIDHPAHVSQGAPLGSTWSDAVGYCALCNQRNYLNQRRHCLAADVALSSGFSVCPMVMRFRYWILAPFAVGR